MSTEVLVDRNLWTVDRSESVLRALLHGRTFDFRVHGPSSRAGLNFFYFSLFFFSFFFNLKLPIMPFSYLLIKFKILKHLEKSYDLINRLFNIIVHYVNELASFAAHICILDTQSVLLTTPPHSSCYSARYNILIGIYF